jgi:hypothetical protein
MKFFAALIAKLTGQAEAPKTLEQARATFGEAKSALDKVSAMFAAAALDFDALLTAGETSLRDHIAAIQGKATTAEAALVSANEAKVKAETDLSTAQRLEAEALDNVDKYKAIFASVGFGHQKFDLKDKDGKALSFGTAEYTNAFQAAWNAHIASAATQKLAELGIKSEKLPSAAAHDEAVSADDLRAQLAAATTSEERGQIAAKLNNLRDAKPTGKN